MDTARLRAAPPVPSIETFLQDGLVNILFVGRIAPNKKIEDHIKLAEQLFPIIEVDGGRVVDVVLTRGASVERRK